MKPTHYVVSNGATVFVKEATFFVSQGGLSQEWGKHWEPVIASSVGEARRMGAKLFSIELSDLYKGEA